tara:strand:+ start:541 stop:1074 length:534 start_codon:yes stop_codon:yes gene_type:complete
MPPRTSGQKPLDFLGGCGVVTGAVVLGKGSGFDDVAAASAGFSKAVLLLDEATVGPLSLVVSALTDLASVFAACDVVDFATALSVVAFPSVSGATVGAVPFLASDVFASVVLDVLFAAALALGSDVDFDAAVDADDFGGVVLVDPLFGVCGFVLSSETGFFARATLTTFPILADLTS